MHRLLGQDELHLAVGRGVHILIAGVLDGRLAISPAAATTATAASEVRIGDGRGDLKIGGVFDDVAGHVAGHEHALRIDLAKPAGVDVIAGLGGGHPRLAAIDAEGVQAAERVLGGEDELRLALGDDGGGEVGGRGEVDLQIVARGEGADG